MLNPGKNSTHEEEFTKDVLINPGYYNDLKLVYKDLGSEKMNAKPGNLIVTILEKKHDRFIRDKNDLHVTIDIGLHDALSAEFIEVEKLDKRIYVISIDYCISPQLVIELPEQGMPILNGNSKGKLCVHFNIIFPEKVPESRLEELRSLLPN